jgi:phospholipase C
MMRRAKFGTERLLDMPPTIKHVFVLALENRSFDHIFGFSGLQGMDAVTGQPTKAEDLIGKRGMNVGIDGRHFATAPDAPFLMPDGSDPGHEFQNVIGQLCGLDKVPRGKLPNGQYPAPINMSGFVADYQQVLQEAQLELTPHLVMTCLDSNKLPILNQLATEFMVCDHWFAAHPGATWVNRFFIHAASGAGYADSPSHWDIFWAWKNPLLPLPAFAPFTFIRGTIYDALARKGHSHQIYIENQYSGVCDIANQTAQMNIKFLDDFVKDISDPAFPHSYVFIEPNSGEEHAGAGGGTEDDMHPPSNVRTAEVLVKRVYESLRNSPLWDKSVLVITFDEHGGMFDHVPPPKVEPLNDGSVDHNYGFRYDQLGVRVPALIISPWVKRNTIDHTVYEHSSIIASVVRLFGLEHLTNRDARAADFLSKLSESAPRTDTPSRLHDVLDHSNVRDVSVPELLAPGQTGEVAITYQNIGATTWTKARGYKLIEWGSRQALLRDSTVTPASIDLPSDVPPGGSVTFKTSIKAPDAPGCRTFSWSMTREGVHTFGVRTDETAVVIGTNQPQLDEASLSFQTSFDGRASDTLVEARLLKASLVGDQSKDTVASWTFTGQPFAPNSVTNWFKMSPGPKFGRFAECQPRAILVSIKSKGQNTWVFVMHLMLNWTGGCSVFIWDSLGPRRGSAFLPLNPLFLSEKNDVCRLLLGAPTVRIAFKVPADKGAHIQGVTTLTVDAKLGASLQLAGIEFAMKYIAVNGEDKSFTLGQVMRGSDDTFALNWDSVHKLPVDRDLTKPDVTLVATALAAPGSKLWSARERPSAFLPVHLD